MNQLDRLRKKLDQAAQARELIDTAERERWDSTACDQAFRRHHELVMEASAIHCQLNGQPGYERELADWRTPYPLLVTAESAMWRAVRYYEAAA